MVPARVERATSETISVFMLFSVHFYTNLHEMTGSQKEEILAEGNGGNEGVTQSCTKWHGFETLETAFCRMLVRSKWRSSLDVGVESIQFTVVMLWEAYQ